MTAELGSDNRRVAAGTILTLGPIVGAAALTVVGFLIGGGAGASLGAVAGALSGGIGAIVANSSRDRQSRRLPSKQPKKGDLFGEWKVVKILRDQSESRVGTARVVRRRQIAFAKFFVLAQTSHKSGADEDRSSVLSRMGRELNLMRNSRSAVICAVLDGAVTNLAGFVVYEHLNGETLLKVIRKSGTLSALQASRVLLNLSRALEKLHGENRLHRDLKPDNVMFIDDFAVLTDLATVISLDDTQNTDDVRGTFAYLAPELRLVLDGPRSKESDLYALGATMYTATTGRPPTSPTSILVADDEIPESLAKTVNRLLGPEPGRRGTASEALKEAQASLKSQGYSTAIRRPHAAAGGLGPRRLPSWCVWGLLAAAISALLFSGLIAAAVDENNDPEGGGSSSQTVNSQPDSTDRFSFEASPTSQVPDTEATNLPGLEGPTSGPNGALTDPVVFERGSRVDIPEANDKPWTMAMSENTPYVVLGSASGVVDIRNVNDGSRVCRFELEPGNSVFAVDITPDGTRVAASSNNGFAYVYAMADCSITNQLPHERSYVGAVSFTSEGRDLVTTTWGSGSSSVQEWSLESSEVIAQAQLADMGYLNCFTISKLGIVVADGGSGRLAYFPGGDLTLEPEYHNLGIEVSSLTTSADEKYLVASHKAGSTIVRTRNWSVGKTGPGGFESVDIGDGAIVSVGPGGTSYWTITKAGPSGSPPPSDVSVTESVAVSRSQHLLAISHETGVDFYSF